MRGSGHAFFDLGGIFMISESFVAEGKFKHKLKYKIQNEAYQGAKEALQIKFKNTEEERIINGYIKASESLIQTTEDESYKEGVKRGLKIMQDLE